MTVCIAAEKALETMARNVAASPPGQRHEPLVNAAISVGGYVQSTCLGWDQAKSVLVEAGISSGHEGGDRKHIERDVTDGFKIGLTKGCGVDHWDYCGRNTKTRFTSNGHTTTKKTNLNLPAGFWTARTNLEQIRQAAWSRGRSPDAVLYACLARTAAISHHGFHLPPIVGTAVPLSLLVALTGPSGVGKSSAWGISEELIPIGYSQDVVSASLGSGEGLIEAFFEWATEPDPENPQKKLRVKRQAHHNLMVFADEGQTWAALGGRQGSVLHPTLRSMFTGSQLGQTNATQERNRHVDAHSYVVGLVLAIQDELAGPLLDDAAAGTPQRFVYASATDPQVPDTAPEWPGSLEWEPPTPTLVGNGWPLHLIDIDNAIRKEVRTADLRAVRRQHQDGHEAHSLLRQLKIAALLALLEQRTSIHLDDWQLAGIVNTTSTAVRNHLAQVVTDKKAESEQVYAERTAQRHVLTAIRTSEWQIVKAAIRIADVVRNDPGIPWSDARRKLSKQQRGCAAEALEHANSEEWIIEQPEEGQGTEKRALQPGPKRPPK